MRPNTSPDFHIQTAAEAFRAGYIRSDPADLSPQARDLVASGGPFTMGDLATTVIEFRNGPGAVSADPTRTVINALSTADFPSIVQTTLRGVSEARPSAFEQDLLALTKRVDVANYQPESFATVDLETPIPSAGTGSRFFAITPSATGAEVQVYSLFARLIVSIQAIANDDRNYIAGALAAFANAAHRAEMQRIAAILETNAAWTDGTALFHADRSNLAVAALDSAGLGTVMATLKSQPTESGLASGANVAALLVHPSDEYTALALVDALPIERQPRVIASPFLSNNDAWYAIAPPAQFPALGRVLMRDQPDSGISVGAPGAASWTDENGKTREVPGIAIDLTHTVGHSVLSPIGAAKFTKT